MDELEIFRRLACAAEGRPSGVGDVRPAVWAAIDEGSAPPAASELLGCQSYFSRMTMLVGSAAAVLLLAGSWLSVYSVYSYITAASMYMPYYDLVSSMFGAY